MSTTCAEPQPMKCSTVITRKTERVEMANKRPKPEEIVALHKSTALSAVSMKERLGLDWLGSRIADLAVFNKGVASE